MQIRTYRAIALTFILSSVLQPLFGQQAENIFLDSKTGTSAKRAACMDQYAGIISLGNIDAVSSDVDLDRSFLCFNDGFQILHNGDADLTGDPDTDSPAGIGYAWYTCAPTVSGPDLASILDDPCLLTNPAPANGIYIFADQLNGDAQFQNGNNVNGQTIPDYFNQGEPVEIFFAPITYDELDNGLARYEGDPSGPCVNVNTDEMFSIVYLNPISFSNRSISTENGCGGSFKLEGGLPEFDNSNYTINIALQGDPGVTAMLNGSDYSHGETVEFSVPQPGTYIVTVEDGKSCGLTFDINVNCDALVFSLPDTIGEQGENICIDITVENFDSISGFQLAITWDPTIIEYTNFEFDFPQSIINVNDVATEQGYLLVVGLMGDPSEGVTLPDGSVFLTICFDLIGDPGDISLVNIGSRGGFPFIVTKATDGPDSQLPTAVDLGSVTIEFPNTVGGNWESCGSGASDDMGSFSITAYGGTPPYTIDWENSGNTLNGSGNVAAEGGTFSETGLPSDTYLVTITDSDGEDETLVVNVAPGGRPDATFTLTDPSCANINNGMIEANVTAAQPHTTFWSTGAANTDVIDDLGSGTYFATVEDNFGCTSEFSVELETTEVQISAEVEDAACQSWNNGSVIAVASGGTPYPDGTYTYRWQGLMANRTDTSRRFGLGPGEYILSVFDSNNCRVTDTFSIDFISRVFVEDVQIDPILCHGDSSIISVSANTTNSTGDHSYAFAWSPNTGSTVTVGRNVTMTNPLSAGSYTVTIVDIDISFNCTFDTTFILDEPPELMLDVVDLGGESCTTGGDGFVTVSASGGTVNDPSDYSYNWSNGDTGSDLNGLSCGNYRVTVTDLNGCTDSVTVNIPCASDLAIDAFDTVSISCPGEADGAITVLFSPFDPDANIEWVDDMGNMYNGQTITNLDAGTYTVTIEATDGCVATDSVTLGGPSGIRLDSIQTIEPSCPGEPDGEIRVFVSGGSGNFDYVWSVQGGGPNAAVLPALSSGVYSVSVGLAGSACEPLFVDDILLEDPPAVEAAFSNILSSSCHNSCDGQATVTPSGGPAMTGNYFVEWSSGETGFTATQLCPGENWAIVTDFQCGDTFFFDIPAPEELITQVLSLDEPSCFGDSDGSISVESTGGTAPYNYQWTSGPAAATFSDIPEGTYVVSTTDANGCTRTDSFDLGQPEELIAEIDSANSRDITCPGNEDGIITIDRSGGNTGATFFTWSPDIGNVNGNVVTEVGPGTYSVTVSDVNDCSDVISFTMTEPDPIEAQLQFEETAPCFGGTIPFTVDSATGGNNGPYRYSINNGLLFDLGEISQLFSGTYEVGVFDNNGCSFDTTIVIDQPNPIEMELGPDLTVNFGDSIALEPENVVSPSPLDSFIWSAGDDILSCLLCPVTTATPLGETLVQLTVVNEDGCTATDEILLSVNTSRKVYIPNAFSPNGDAINDRFQVYVGQGVAGVNFMRIFNRWGDQVFERSNIPVINRRSEGWDGDMAGQPLNPGVYVYLVEVAFVDGSIELYKGEVHLVR